MFRAQRVREKLWKLSFTLSASGILVAAVGLSVSRYSRPAFGPLRSVASSAYGPRATSAAASPAAQDAQYKRVYLIRHGQAEHNVFFESGQKEIGRKIRDPGLTALGVNQAKVIKQNPDLTKMIMSYKNSNEKALLVVSPLRRTLQTALSAFEDHLGGSNTGNTGSSPLVFVCNSDIQETGEIPCDCGRPLSEVMEEFGQHQFIDFSHVQEDWHEKTGDNRDRGPLLQKRFNRFTKWVMDRPEKDVIVVAHHNIFLANVGVSFRNCEVREYKVNSEGEWRPVFPLVSTHDDQLTPEDKTHLGIYEGHVREKMKGWGLSAPARFR
eukprot:CAMPEP_0184490014 /NCGR_PEP_ID=MMETSP0113_2-20130426/16931_1 /TAXON_ID=91329 /ORGANISM="Norrisiella sphaerica, Strain BC52" /LENGTH=323 /DNA_ID=CAMNT_0026873739 /DNA_START=43 /DNA_END=1014 /DNA_ORIENTATION=-